MQEDGLLSLKPSNMSFQEAAAVPGGAITALALFRYAKINEGQDILVYGASGSVGTYFIQLAKNAGAEITGVCSSKNFDLVKSLGAEYVIDYTKEDFTESDKKYDLVLDAVDKLKSSKGKNTLKKNGVYLNVSKDFEKEGQVEILTKKPLRPCEQETDQNPRSRSARLRAVQKI